MWITHAKVWYSKDMKKEPPKDRNIRIKLAIYRKLKILAAQKGLSLSKTIEALLK